MNEALLNISIAVKAVVDYSAVIDSTHENDYNTDGVCDTYELSRQIAEDIVASIVRPLDYYVYADGTTYADIPELVTQLKADVEVLATDPINQYANLYALSLVDVLQQQLDSASSFAISFEVNCSAINVAVDNVYTITLTESADINFSYTAIAGVVIAVTHATSGTSFKINITAEDASAAMLSRDDIPAYNLGLIDYSYPITLVDYITNTYEPILGAL